MAGAADRLLPLLPGGLVVAIAFASGGFLPGLVALAATALAVLLAMRITLVMRPWGALSVGYVAGAVTLGLLAAWTLISATWSDAAARAVTEYDRALLYLLGFVVLGSLGRTPARLRWLVRGLAAAAFVVCLCGLITRLAPDVWPIDPTVSADRLSYPLGYWNALGLLAAIGIVLCFALTSDDREPPVARVLTAAALPVLAPALLLTFSRGAIAAGAIGFVAFIVAGRPRALLSGLLVAMPAITVSTIAAYDADLLATDNFTSATATVQGHQVALVVAVCAVLAAGVRAVLLRLDRRVVDRSLPMAVRRPAVGWGAAGVVAIAGIVVVLAGGVPDAFDRQYDRFVAGDDVGRSEDDLRSRLTNPGNNGRLGQWRVTLNALAREPVLGEGAGTYALQWDRHRPAEYQVEDAHSLYAEVAGELGMVGLLLVSAAVLLMLGGFVARVRGTDRTSGGALFGAGLAWAVHAGIDWDWEMPAVTFWFFAAGGLALAAPAPAAGDESRGLPPLVRTLVALGCLLLALLPARFFLSEAPLHASARAFAAGDCATAVDRALDSTAALGIRPEPFILLGYCDVRLGRTDLAVRALRKAVHRDPGNWEGHYGLAVVRAAAGLDPRPALRRARQLNPREALIAQTGRLLETSDTEAWRRRALRARLPTD